MNSLKRELFVLHWHLTMCLWSYELRLDEIVDARQENGGGRYFRKRQRDIETSQAFFLTETYVIQWCSHTCYYGNVHCHCSFSLLSLVTHISSK